MAHNISDRKQREIDAQILARDLAWLRDQLCVSESAHRDHVVVAVCACGRRRRVWPKELMARGRGKETWKAMVRAQVFVCSACGKGARKLEISAAPVHLVDVWSDAPAS